MVKGLYITPKTKVIVISVVLCLIYSLYQIFTDGYLKYSKAYFYIKVTQEDMSDYAKNHAVVSSVLSGDDYFSDVSSDLSFNIKCYLSARSGIDIDRFNVVVINEYIINNTVTYIVSLPSSYIDIVNSLASDLKDSLIYYINEAYKTEFLIYCDDITKCYKDEVIYLDEEDKKHIEDYFRIRDQDFNIRLIEKVVEINKTRMQFLFESLFFGIVLGIFAGFLIRK